MTSIEKAVERIEQSEDLLIKVDGNFAIRDLVNSLNDRDFHAIVIDRAPVFDKTTLMHALYQSLRLPGYFGFNWDSLKDMLAAIDGVRGNGFVLAFTDLSLLSDEVRNEFLEVVAEANEIRQCHENLKRLRVLTLKT
jgi:RNAse (barnase) inhibitor barstar